ncbi:MAG: GC-type dockerin domain-anchored protein [Planctomycetota bacterium]
MNLPIANAFGDQVGLTGLIDWRDEIAFGRGDDISGLGSLGPNASVWVSSGASFERVGGIDDAGSDILDTISFGPEGAELLVALAKGSNAFASEMYDGPVGDENNIAVYNGYASDLFTTVAVGNRGWMPVAGVELDETVVQSDTFDAAVARTTDGNGIFVLGEFDNGTSTNLELRLLSFDTVAINDFCARADVTTTGAIPGGAGWGVPDGAVDASDLTYMIEQNTIANDTMVIPEERAAARLEADVTTDGENPGDPAYGFPDGAVTTSDLNTFVEWWLTACP